MPTVTETSFADRVRAALVEYMTVWGYIDIVDGQEAQLAEDLIQIDVRLESTTSEPDIQ